MNLSDLFRSCVFFACVFGAFYLLTLLSLGIKDPVKSSTEYQVAWMINMRRMCGPLSLLASIGAVVSGLVILLR